MKKGNFRIWKEVSFWTKWLDMEIKESSDISEPKPFAALEDPIVKKVKDITQKMILLKISGDKIKE
jgi:hypothetical protein